jgi:hypothetical protein
MFFDGQGFGKPRIIIIMKIEKTYAPFYTREPEKEQEQEQEQTPYNQINHQLNNPSSPSRRLFPTHAASYIHTNQ